MLSFNTYHRPESLDAAYQLLNKNKRSQLIGGGAFIRMGNRRLTDAIDISALSLDEIGVNEQAIRLGAMTTFHTLEMSKSLPDKHKAYFQSALSQIVGIQLRNMVTVGATVYSRYGFSDLNTALLALGGAVHLYKQGKIEIESFFEQALPDRDILEYVDVCPTIDIGLFKSARLSTADYALLNLALVKSDGKYRIAVGARPHRAKLAHETMAYLNKNELTGPVIDTACQMLAQEIPLGSNRMASATYRKALSGGLLKEALIEIVKSEMEAESDAY